MTQAVPSQFSGVPNWGRGGHASPELRHGQNPAPEVPGAPGLWGN